MPFWPIYILIFGRSKSGDKELIPKNFRLLPTQTFQLNRLMFTMTWLSFMSLPTGVDINGASLLTQMVKSLPAMQETQVLNLTVNFWDPWE